MTSNEVKELRHSIAWQAYCKELEGDIEKLTKSLVTSSDFERVLKTQAKIVAIQEVMKARLDAIEDSGT